DRLGSDDFAEKESAVEALGAGGDKGAVAALKALADGKLYLLEDKHVAIGEPGDDRIRLTDPVDLQPRGTVAREAANKVRVNNRLRTAIGAALSHMTLASDRREDRLAAAREALRHPSAETAVLLQAALDHERDPEIQELLNEALAVINLNQGTKQERLNAIKILGGASDPEIRNLLAAAAAAPDLDPEIAAALKPALASMGVRLQFLGFALTLFQGLSLGSVILLAAIGLAITFGVMGVINMAHGEMIMIGAYTTFTVQELFRALLPAAWFDAYLLAAIPAAFLVAGLVGILIERGIIRFLYGRPLETMLATWGVSLILQQLVRTLFGAQNKEVANPAWMTGGIDLVGGVTITWNRLVILGFCFVVLACLALILRRTSFGLAMRAVTQNRDMAAAMGIATARVDALTFGLGSAIAGMAGVALSQVGNVSPNLGTLYIVDSFLVVVFGGVGNLLGTLFGAMGLGVVDKLLEPVAGAVLGKVAVLVAVILFIQRRPRGLFALKGRAAEG
ncbi:MAG TPA: urea ABC transporter permease subunit UrtB, partial [Stellaceae bacterium]|nr:urea ABC transporter permease subunit UrtB [Stellaceae bacterium]